MVQTNEHEKDREVSERTQLHGKTSGNRLDEHPDYQKWLAGDEEAWEKLVDTYYPMVFKFCYQFTRQHSLAEEYTQEVFLRLFRNMPYLGHHTNLKLWLMRTAYNYCVDAHRKKKNEMLYLRKFWKEIRDIWRLTPQSNMSDDKDRQKIVETVMERLPEDLQAILIMREYLEMTYEEMSDALNIPIGTVKSRLNRARKLFTQYLIELEFADSEEGTEALLRSLLYRIL